MDAWTPAKLTDKIVKELPAPPTGNRLKRDTVVSGFAIRVTAAGARAFVLDYRVKVGAKAGTKRLYTLGGWPEWTTIAARHEAAKLKRLVDQGRDPVAERAADSQAPTVTALCARFLAEHVDEYRKPRTRKDYHRIVERNIKPRLGKLKIKAVEYDDIAKLHREMRGSPRQANYTVAILSKMFNLAEKWKLRPQNSNPCRHISRYPENERDRFLEADELQRLGQVLREAEAERSIRPEVANCLRFLVLTGMRLSEAVELEWSSVKMRAGKLSLADAKAGARDVQLGAHALALLASLDGSEGRVFGDITVNIVERAWSGEKPQPKYRKPGRPGIRDRAGISDARIHDLRHTTGTYAGSAGLNQFIVRDLLGHKTLVMAGRYVSRRVDPLREAADTVSGRIAAAMDSPAAEVVEIKERRA